MAWTSSLRVRDFLGIWLTLSLIGCGGGQPTPATTETSDPDLGTVVEMPTEPVPAASADPSTPSTNSETAVAAVQSSLNAVREGKLHQAYDFLPARYQSDIDALVHDFAGKMDPQVWKELFATLQKGAKVLREKKSMLVGMMYPPGLEAQSQVMTDNWDRLVDNLDTVLQSDLSDLEKLKQANTKGFLETTVNPLFAQLKTLGAATGPNPLDQLSEVRVTLVSEADGETVLEIVPPNRPEAAEETVFVKVDGKWIPESLASNWETSMSDAREQLAALTPEVMAAQTPRILAALKGVNESFDQMLVAENPEDISAAAFPLLLQGAQLNAMFNTPEAPADGVTIIVIGELDDDAQTKLLGDLEALTDRPQSSTYSASASGGETIINLKPVKDPVAFAEKLTFAKQKDVDVATRTIRIELE